jgi:hydrogenase assembly chaperone HypC/HupF
VCIEFPSRVVSVDEHGATVDREGRLRRASTLLLPDIEPGDWVFVAAGTIVERLQPDEAQMIRTALLEALDADATDAAVTTPRAAPTGGFR